MGQGSVRLDLHPLVESVGVGIEEDDLSTIEGRPRTHDTTGPIESEIGDMGGQQRLRQLGGVETENVIHEGKGHSFSGQERAIGGEGDGIDPCEDVLQADRSLAAAGSVDPNRGVADAERVVGGREHRIDGAVNVAVIGLDPGSHRRDDEGGGRRRSPCFDGKLPLERLDRFTGGRNQTGGQLHGDGFTTRWQVERGEGDSAILIFTCKGSLDGATRRTFNLEAAAVEGFQIHAVIEAHFDDEGVQRHRLSRCGTDKFDLGLDR